MVIETARVRLGQRGESLDVDSRRHAVRERHAFNLACVVSDPSGAAARGPSHRRDGGGGGGGSGEGVRGRAKKAMRVGCHSLTVIPTW